MPVTDSNRTQKNHLLYDRQALVILGVPVNRVDSGLGRVPGPEPTFFKFPGLLRVPEIEPLFIFSGPGRGNSNFLFNFIYRIKLAIVFVYLYTHL